MITREDFTRVNSDVNGNPRFVFHFLHLINENDRKENDILSLYEIALKKCRQFGRKKIPQ
jgi:hypothetical protein